MDGNEAKVSCPSGWEERQKPLTWSRRFDFVDYAATRAFLDQLADLSESRGYYPNLNFARTFVVVAIQFDDASPLSHLVDFAHQAQLIYLQSQGT